jgi:uncharacterized membrane protein
MSFPDAFRAKEFLTAINRLASRGELVLEDAVIVVKTAEGKTMVEETTDPPPGRAALSGGMWAGLFGLFLGGPVGWIVGGAIGAGVGAVTAKVVDHGIPDEWVAWFREAVQEGTTTVAVLLEAVTLDALVQEAERFAGASLIYANLDPHTIDRLRGALGQPVPPPYLDTVPTTGSGRSGGDVLSPAGDDVDDH